MHNGATSVPRRLWQHCHDSFLFPYLAGPLWQSWGRELSVTVATRIKCSFDAAKLSQDLFQ